jgi:hypothetical protein
MNSIDKQCIYLDLELHEDQSKLQEPQLYLEQHVDRCVILDEIQRVPELFPVLRGLIDKNRTPGRFIILGSASPELLKQSSESLAGRIAYKELAPFNCTELLPNYSMNRHWFRGGFPEAFLSTDDDFCRIWTRNFVQTYLERDLPLLGLTVSPALMRRLWSMLAHLHGSIFNASTISRSLGVTVPTVNRYIDFLDSAFIVNRLHPFYLNLRKRLVKSPKVYIADSGITTALLQLKSFEQAAGHPAFGSLWETTVLSNLMGRFPDLDISFYRTNHGAEVDFVLSNAHKTVVVECKASVAPKLTPGNYSSLEDIEPDICFIAAPISSGYPVEDGIEVVSLYELMSNIAELLD